MVVSDRDYQCLGQWEEDGALFTMTRRRDVDVGVVECFVGFYDEQKGLFLMESGPTCRRGLPAVQKRMLLTKKSKVFAFVDAKIIMSHPLKLNLQNRWTSVKCKMNCISAQFG